MELILASRSPRRKKILQQLARLWPITFKVIPSDISEELPSPARLAPAALVKTLALKKAAATAAKIKQGIVLGADTIVFLNNKIIGKPKDAQEAVKILRQLSGSKHWVYTGLALIEKPSGRKLVGFEKTRVSMRKFSRDEIKRLAGKHLDKAGAYAIQEGEDAFVEKIEGDYYNVVGLPVKKLAQMLSKLCVRFTHTDQLSAILPVTFR